MATIKTTRGSKTLRGTDKNKYNRTPPYKMLDKYMAITDIVCNSQTEQHKVRCNNLYQNL